MCCNDGFAATHMAKDDQLSRSRGIVPFGELGIHEYPLASVTGSEFTKLRVEPTPLFVFVDTQ